MKIFSAQLKGTTTVVSGSTASITGSFTGSIAGIDINETNAFTASTIARLNSIETISSSNDGRVNSLESFTSSTSARLNSIETTSASVNTLNTTQNTRLTNLEIKTGSLATTGSNTFIGTQTITGSLFISSDLVVQGSSSLQNITASAVSIGTNIINLNTANPAIRYAGLSIGDSGSVGGSGSFLYDSVQDEMIFVHRGANTTVTSSVVLMGPQTFDSIGNETYPTLNIIQKGTGNEHLGDSCIFDNGTTTCVKNNLIGTGTACFGSTITSAGDIVTPTRIAADTYNGYTGGSTPLTIQTGGAQSVIIGTNANARLTIANTGIACFSCQVCSPSLIVGGNINEQLVLNFVTGGGSYTHQSFRLNGVNQYRFIGNTNGNFVLRNDVVSADVLTISCTGVANFACRICSPGALLTNDLQINGTSSGKIVGFSNYSNNNVGLSLYNTAGTEVIYLNANVGQIGATTMASTYFSGTCLTLNSFSSGNGFKMNYGNASGEITAINLIANGTTNGFIGIQMVDGSNGDLWLGSSANRSVTIYRTGNAGFNTNNPCTRIHAEGGYGARFGCNSYFYGGGVAGGQFPYGDQYGNGASYTYQEANTTATNTSLFGGYAAGYFRGGNGGGYGGGGAGIVAIGGDGGNAESVNSGGGAGLFARAGKNGAGSAHSFAGWFDGGNVIVRCGNLGVGTNSPISLLQVGCVGNSTIRLGTSSTTNTSASYSFGAWNSTGGDILTVRGDGLVAFAKINDFTTGNAANTWINPNSSWGIYINTSSCRYKRNISNYDKGIDTVNQLRPVYYKGTSEVDGDKQFVGLIAEEIHELGLTEFVNYNDEGLPNSLSYPNMIALAFNAIKEQQCTIDTLKSCLGIN